MQIIELEVVARDGIEPSTRGFSVRRRARFGAGKPKNLDEFWRNLAEGRDCITEVPPLRWDVDAFYRPGDVVPEKTNSRWVGALEAFDRFDPLFFNISPTEAEFMDPQQRLFLQVCWHGIENAGYDASTLSGSRCGVFVGCAAGEYQELSRRHRLSAQGFTGNASSILAARISYFLNLQGPSVSVDTACSSSLVTIAQACDALSSGDIDLALAGGVYVMAGPEMHIRSAQAGMLSPEGRCYTFDQRANGFVPGEGVGVVVLKRLADAERDQDIIHGVVEGWGTNQDGKTNGITAPNPESQTRLMRDVYDKYAIDPANIQLIEAHGTGTKLGDPIEVEALKASFQHHAREKHSCALGSVKSNIGHCLTAAGIAGTLKLVLALQHRQLPPTINFERLNEHIDLSESPFYVNTRLDAWEPKGGARRQAAISSFGFSGTNAHLVIGEYRPAVEAERAVSIVPDGTATIVPLSAKTTNQLRQKARDLLGFIRNAAQPAELAEIAYTLQVGREAMDERVAFLVSSLAQLAERLQAWIDGDRSLDGAWQGRAQRSKDALSLLGSDADPQRTIESWIASRRLSKLAEVWVKGVALDWNELHGQTRPRRIPLPVYPFAEERYWIDAAAIAAETGAATALLHPLLHENASDLEETRFRSTFTGLEPFLTERAGRKILSAAACLEMARAAVEHALPARSDSKTLELRDTEWAQPIVVVAGTQVQVALHAAGEDQIDYEIYTEADEQEIVHCRGRAMLTATPARATVDPPREHGPGAEFRLPAAEGASDYVLHPGSIDAALQAAASWIDRESGPSRQPFALETLRIVAPCSAEMVARVRGDASRVEIDLCDANGKVCVELRGLSLRVTSCDVGSVIAVPQWQTREVVSTSAPAFTERHVVLCELPRVDAGHLASLLPRSHCAAVEVDPQRNIAQRYGEHAVACFERVQAILARQVEGPVLVQIVIGEDEERAVLAGLSGILKTAALEHSRLVGQLLLVPPDLTTDELGTLLEQEQGLDPLVRSARDKRQVLRWQELEDTPDMPPVAFRDDGVYLITGGLGGLGLLFARAILESARDARVVLTGRAAAIPETRARLEALSPHVDRVTYQSLDLGDLAQVRQLIADVVARHRRLDGVLHAAGMTADNFVTRKTSAEFAAVLAPKVAGTFHVDEATRDVPLDFFALFSSIASAVGNPGQADYAAANGFLDHFAAWRNRQVAAKQRHGLTRAVNWSLWQAGGMAIDRATQELVQQTIGAQPLRSATGLQAFHRSLAIASDQMLVVEGNRGRIRGYLQKARMLESAPDAERATAEPETKAAIGLGELQQQLKAAIAGVLRIDASIIDVDQPFAEFGLDSFLGAELIVAINRKYGTDLSHSRLFDYSTVREFAAFLGPEIRQLAADSGDRAPAPRGSAPLEAASFPVLERTVRRRTTATRASSDDRIAIIGMSGRYPQANDLRQYWANLVAGRNSIVEVPASRWDVDRYYDPDRSRKDKTYSRWLGALDDFDRFDPLFFRISPQEAEYMDPQQRLFLQESYRAFEDAGYSTATLSNRKCGVYLGISTNEYMSLLSKKGVMSAPVTSNSSAIAAARISYYLNLKGPAISVDTACSSSLVAIHLACQALLNGEIDMALAGGVSLWLSADSYVAMSQAGMFSPDGQCKTFDESANGIVNGEGVGAVVLKRLHEAEAAGDLIYGVILGSGINQDGRTNGITAPSVNSQIELERSLYARHQIDPETITYVETHGTGTKLGDPIELEALSTVFKEKTSRTNFCALGSVKSNIGHTTSAAGVAGLQKVLLSMRHRTLVPTLNVTKENSRFDLQRSPFYISSETKPWEVGPGALRRAAVSSFGFSGTNAHLVVEEYRSPALHVAAPVESGPTIVPLSARTPEQLRRRVHDLLEFVRAAQEPLDLASIAWTLQVGREAMEERVGFVVRSVDQLAEKLGAWAGGEKELDGVYQGRVEPGSDGMTIIGRDDDMLEAIERWIARGKLTALVDLWVRGLDLDWNKLRGEAKPRRVSLPAYPFATERCWIDDPSPGAELDDLIVDADWKSIEQIIERIADDAIDTEHAVRALRMIV
ncbi:MAG: SDR family NAD(P)-dependent oxidoreductase [Thermoanaerobaculia bacterium]